MAKYHWAAGRQLERMESEDTKAAFVYNADGLRVRKTVNGVATDYTLNGKLISHLKRGDDELHFFYDAQGRASAAEYGGKLYGYAHNLQGDIVAILDPQGEVMVEYEYEAWGNPITVTGEMAETLGKLNPFRYRGYVWDEETGLYYLRSRYYCPRWGRFLNANTKADEGAGILRANFFCYCANSAPNGYDPTGEDFWSDLGGSLYHNWVQPWADRYEEVCDNPSFYSVGNYLTSGAFDTVKGAVAPEKPLSLQHWLDSAAVTSWIVLPCVKLGTTGLHEGTLKLSYPPNKGFAGKASRITLYPGSIVDRIGGVGGKFVSLQGTASDLLSVPYDKIGIRATTYAVKKPISVLVGYAAPWFGQKGGGIQFYLYSKIFRLINVY